MRIYLDVCCLNRPFDDHAQDRVRLESEAVLTILNHSQAGNWYLLGSEVIDIEISKILVLSQNEWVNNIPSPLTGEG